MKYKIDLQISDADGHQSFETHAKTKEEAAQNFKDGNSTLVESCVEVLGFEVVNIEEIYTEE